MLSLNNLFHKQTKKTEKPLSPTQSSTTPQPVPWHDFTIKELLQLSNQNSWTDVQNEISSLIITLSTYNPPKSTQTSAPKQITIPTNHPSNTTTNNNNNQHSTETETKNNPEKHENESKSNIEQIPMNIDLHPSNIQSNLNPNKLLQIFREEFHCDICLDIYIEPLTLACGHTFCRLCVIQIQSKCKKKCPLCKAVCHINAFLHSPNIIIAKCSQRLYSTHAYNQRILQLQQEKKQLSATIAAFILNVIRFPGQLLQLHLFEMRYLHMINRAISSGKRFAYVCREMNYSSVSGGGGYQPYCNDIALLIYVKECQFLPNGRCYMVGVCERRILVTSAWVESGTQGLWMIKYKEYMDEEYVGDDVGDEDGQRKEQKIEKHWVVLLKEFIECVYASKSIALIESECGERQCLQMSYMNISKWSFYVCGVIVFYFRERNVSLSFIRNSLKTCDVVERIQSCYDILKGKRYVWKGKCSGGSQGSSNGVFDVD